ncbi:MAG: PilZ domain-containing protein [Candidatus Omnitrophica bacterium]|nr:PilZ domain-containing protein [Candidatus Omnitrophota bacterium]
MGWPDEKRQYLRIGGFLDGQCERPNGMGSYIMLMDFTRQGVRACLNNRVEAGETLSMEVWIPGSIIPVFAAGSVVWCRPAPREWTYQYDCGIRVTQISSEDCWRMLDFVYAQWCAEKKNA